MGPTPLVVAAAAACLLSALWAVRSKPEGGKGRGAMGSLSSDHPNGDAAGHEKGHRSSATGPSAAERPAGVSMMELLVPEITTHALSYLDFTSLCRLSMTNSSMRRAANDDNAWKALYHKDFTLEQDSVVPLNGWKAYYAVTKAVLEVNAEFYDIIRERSLTSMIRLWLNADYIKCIHASGEYFTGYASVMDSWAVAFRGEPVTFTIHDVRARVTNDMAWVTMKASVDVDSGPFAITNVYEFRNGRWKMVHHHSSVLLLNGMVLPE